jgi:hypothetical protein
MKARLAFLSIMREVSRKNFGGIVIPEWELSAEDLFPGNIGILGGSGSGKTTTTMYLIDIINRSKLVPAAQLFNPTQVVQYKTVIPEPYRSTMLDGKKIELILNRQKRLKDVYVDTHQLDFLKEVYNNYCQATDVIQTQIGQIELAGQTALREFTKRPGTGEIEVQKFKLELQAHVEKVTIELYRLTIMNYIRAHPEVVNECQEAYVKDLLVNIGVNPNLLVIFDDVAPEISAMGKSKSLSELYFQGRHYFIGSLMILQDDTCMSKQLRNNMHKCFFTSAAQLISYFDHGGGSRDDKKIADTIAASGFFNNQNKTVFRALIYDRSAGGVWGYIENKQAIPEMFGSTVYQEYAQVLNQAKIQSRKLIVSGGKRKK